ncbi:hypothetical protein KY495_06910 [Massilia sp. PAMC28688]|uniref:hypothetical protein n=1 Tax=Massilia sp. PAMC28688 TaxID=2861283 RepID=UPI001C63A5AE|nr:hypothetical protein [Massilia sp. PAMC28688]QYF94903.1 hypothetical protein KY495_06910 [Massilia sp. PAMC28688]
MVRWFFQFLYGSVPVRFVSQYSIAEAILRLSKVVKPSVLSSFAGQCAVGTVSQSKVRVERVIPFVGNAWKPFFYGTFTAGEAGAVLEGAFKFSAFTRIFMSIWFGFILFWTLLATVAILQNSPADLWFPLAGVGMFAAGVAMVRVGKWFARNDVAWLTQLIAQELGANSYQSTG